MASWSIAVTLRAPEPEVMAFLAHHLELGPERIILLFDDPDDPVADLVARIPRVEVQRCDDDWWDALRTPRPERHQRRQGLNAHAAYLTSGSDWLFHTDIDEFLLADTPVSGQLDRVPPDRPLLRIAPFEALHDPDMADDIFTARHFRQALPGEKSAALRAEVFGRYASLLPAGVLSHAVGKCFFRSGIRGLHPWIHGATLHGRRMPPGRAAPGMALLHFHAADPQRWKAQLPFRLARGAYVLKPELQSWLSAASPAEINDFYTDVLTATPAALAVLRERGLLREARLDLRAKAAGLRATLG